VNKESVYKEIEKLEFPEDKLYIKSINSSTIVIGKFIDFAKGKKVLILEGTNGSEILIEICYIVEIRAILSNINDVS